VFAHRYTILGRTFFRGEILPPPGLPRWFNGFCPSLADAISGAWDQRDISDIKDKSLKAYSILSLFIFASAIAAADETPFFTESFDDAALLERGWYDGDKFQISPDKPYAGAGSIEYSWESKTSGPSSSTVRHLFTPTESVYLRFHIRLSKGWGWTGRDYHPHLIQFLTTENVKYAGPAATHLTLYVEPQAGKLRLAAQDIENKDAPHGLTQGPLRGGYNGKLYDSAERLFKDDAWHCVEAFFQLNSVDAAKANSDGIARAWFDGKLVVDRTDLIFRSPDFPKMKINQLLLAPYFGPGLLPHAQTLWIDELTVAQKRNPSLR
jgi:hypothetical protein